MEINFIKKDIEKKLFSTFKKGLGRINNKKIHSGKTKKILE
jgi:hypothetical protein